MRRRTTAGRSAHHRFRAAQRAWRPRALTRFCIALGVIGAALTGLAVWLATPFSSWLLGFASGASVMLLAVALDHAPARVENWRTGADAERRTAAPLSALDRDLWHVHHDLECIHGNRDHVVVGPPGVFLLDTKHRRGRIRVDGDVIHADDGTGLGETSHSLGPAQRGAAVLLRDDLAHVLGASPWVTAVVVLWSDFPQRVATGDRVTYVHGDELLDWLRSRPARLSPERAAAVSAALTAPSRQRREPSPPGGASQDGISSGSRPRSTDRDAAGAAAVPAPGRV